VIDRGVHPSAESTPNPDLPAPPVVPNALSERAGGPNAAAVPAASSIQPSTREAQPRPAVPAHNAERELIEAISPTPEHAQQAQPSPEKTPPPELPAATQSLPHYIFVNDHFIESPNPATRQTSSPGQPETKVAALASSESKPVNWEELGLEGEQRIIRIPADKLANGDANYNIVIQPDDWIRLDPGHNGVFYIMGHVSRPGVYSLTGQEITLRQAVAAAGGLDALAWPTRCEIVRRIDGDREEMTQWDIGRIIDGQDPDLFLKPEDVVNVGTHAVAPLLATIRNAFRLTYGFGFVYDRNFADFDTFTPQQNPRERRRTELSQRFPGLFP